MIMPLPANTARIVRIMFAKIFAIAGFPPREYVCTAKVEKVVKEPKKPVPMIKRVLWSTYPMYSLSYINIPKNRLPNTLTKSVPVGDTVVEVIRYLEIAPKKPPEAMPDSSMSCLGAFITGDGSALFIRKWP